MKITRIQKIKNNLAKSERGFSILEMIFATSILMITTIFVFNSVQSSQMLFEENNLNVKERNQLRNAILVIKRDLREAKQGIDSASCNVDAPNGVCIKSSPPTLSFKVPELTVGTSTSYKTVKYVYDSSAQTITRYEIPSVLSPVTSAVIGRSITSSSFSQSNAAYVQMAVASSTQSLSSEIALRNK